MPSLAIRRLCLTLFVIGIAAVAWLSLFPLDSVPSFKIWDKLQHAAAFAALSFTGGGAFGTRRSERFVAIGLCGYGAAIEVIQSFIPGRMATFGDFAADVVGIAVGLAVLWLVEKALRRQSSRG